MTDESSNQIINVLLTPPNDSNIPHKTPIFLYIKHVYIYLLINHWTNKNTLLVILPGLLLHFVSGVYLRGQDITKTQDTTWATTIKVVFGYARSKKDWAKVSIECTQDRRAWSASVRGVVNSIGDAGSIRPGWMLTQVQVRKIWKG